MRQFTYINCWYISDHESAAMWNLYAQTKEAIAIQTTYEKLHLAMASDCYIGEVKYIDYKNDVIPISNAFNPHMIKRKAFEHERELRAIIQDHETPSKRSEDGGGKEHDYSVVNDKNGLAIEIDPIQLIDSVFVAPMCSGWFKNLVESICVRSGFSSTSVITSELDEEPY